MVRRPMDGARRNTGDTAEHAWRGVGPATDYGADMGEPIYAPFSGRIGGWWSGTGGNVVQVVGAGVTFVGQHLSGRAVAIGTYVNEGDLIGYVGSTGLATTGPHLHWWVEVGGTRISGETYMHRVGLGYTPYGSRTPNTQPAGGGTTPFPPEEDNQTMQILKNKNDTSITSSHFLWGNGIVPEIISDSTVSIYKDAGIKVYTTTRERWLWLYEHEAKRAKGAETCSCSGSSADLTPVIERLDKVPTADENATAVRARFATNPLK